EPSHPTTLNWCACGNGTDGSRFCLMPVGFNSVIAFPPSLLDYVCHKRDSWVDLVNDRRPFVIQQLSLICLLPFFCCAAGEQQPVNFSQVDTVRLGHLSQGADAACITKSQNSHLAGKPFFLHVFGD